MEPVSLLRSRLESLLLVADEPTTATDFARLLDVSAVDVTETLTEIATEFSDRGMGFEPVSYTHLTLPTILRV